MPTKTTRHFLRPGTRVALFALVAGLVLAFPARQSAHDIPGDVTIQAFVKPEGQQLRLLVRVPLEALSDMAFPTYGPGYLDFETARRRDQFTDAAMVWMGQEVQIFENGTRLSNPTITAIKISLPSNRAFESYETALEHVQGPLLRASTQIVWQQAVLDVLFDYRIQSDRSEFSIRPSLERMGLRVVTVLRFLPPGSAERAFELHGDPGLVRLDPRWHQAALRFVVMGFEHILDGTDHLLFLACLIIPFRRIRALAVIVTAFTIAHSFTLIASAYNLAPDALWFPPLVETLIATSIVYMALENIVGAKIRRRWAITFIFGLVHGFGFSFALRETLQFAGAHLLTSLLSFNIGVELGQLLVLVLLVPALNVLFRYVVAERMGIILLSVLVAHTGWHWLTERWGVLSQFPITWAAFSRAMFTGAMGWLILLMLLAGIVWVGFKVLQPASPRVGDEVAAD
ncbi:MAG: HupE/UreJ family protein [Acidobacteria bacterium]|nr:MAG: HupE/UreJ family protein [Acidobacteriota bacterium]